MTCTCRQYARCLNCIERDGLTRISVHDIMTGPSPMSPKAAERAEEIRRHPRRPLRVKPLPITRIVH